MRVVLVGEQREAVLRECAYEDRRIEIFDDGDSAWSYLRNTHDVIGALVLGPRVSDARALVARLRSHPRWLALPVVFLVEHFTTAAVEAAHAMGADDVLPKDAFAELGHRLASLDVHQGPSQMPASRGTAIVSHRDARRRAVLGRYLRWAGYDLIFAQGASDLMRVARETYATVELVVSEEEDGTLDCSMAMRALRREYGEDVSFVWLANRARVPAVRRRLQGVHGVIVGPEDAPADHLLFHINEMKSGSSTNLRDSRRLLVSALCHYRGEGEREGEHGSTYNVSRHGLYVRTLNPPAAGELVWVEVKADDGARWLHLRGRVVWRSLPGWKGGAAPAGFAIELSADACPKEDYEAWIESYEGFLARERDLERRIAMASVELKVLERVGYACV